MRLKTTVKRRGARRLAATASGVARPCSRAKRALADVRDGRMVCKVLLLAEGSRAHGCSSTDRLIGNPHVQPPLPSDWEVQPTHPRHAVPYFLAPLWDASVATRRDAEQRRVDAKYRVRVAAQGPKGHVPKDLRQTMKRAKGARTLLQELEEEVRRFVADWERKQEDRRDKGLHDADSDEDEIVFVGRNGAMHDLPPSPKANRAPTLEDLKREMLVYGGLEADRQARFG